MAYMSFAQQPDGMVAEQSPAVQPIVRRASRTEPFAAGERVVTVGAERRAPVRTFDQVGRLVLPQVLSGWPCTVDTEITAG